MCLGFRLSSRVSCAVPVATNPNRIHSFTHSFGISVYCCCSCTMYTHFLFYHFLRLCCLPIYYFSITTPAIPTSTFFTRHIRPLLHTPFTCMGFRGHKYQILPMYVLLLFTLLSNQTFKFYLFCSFCELAVATMLEVTSVAVAQTNSVVLTGAARSCLTKNTALHK